MAPQPCPEELWDAAEADLVPVAASHGEWLIHSIGKLLCSSGLLASEEALRSFAVRLALLLPLHPHLEPFMSHLLKLAHAQPLRVTAAMTASDVLAVLRACQSLSVGAPQLMRPPFVYASDLLLLLDHNSTDVATAASQLVSTMLQLSDAQRALLCGIRPFQNRGMEWMPHTVMSLTRAPRREFSRRPPGDDALPKGVTCVGGELFCHFCEPGDLRSRTEARLVPTQHCQRALRSLSTALSSLAPVLLSGPTGSGKSALLTELAEQMGHRDKLVRVHMDEQIDSKVLLGTFVCTEAVGEFKWQPGVITQAVANGHWLLLEDVDRAPMEVMASLASLVESRRLYLPGRAMTLRAPSSFRLWASITTQGRRPTQSNIFRSALWQHVNIPAPSATDLALILATRHPRLSLVAPLMVRTLVMLLQATCSAMLSEDSWPEDSTSEVMEETAERSERTGSALETNSPEKQLESIRCALGAGRTFSSRDLLKWASRTDIALEALGVGKLPAPEDPQLTSQIRELVLLEGLDTFVCAVRRPGPRQQVASMLAHIWQVLPERLHYLTNLYKPTHVDEHSRIRVGRVTLSKAPSIALRDHTSSVRFANTRQTLMVMERVAACIQMVEPVLLVGETGTGKTTVVQQLAQSLGRMMLVHNLSEQSDTSDLLGGFRPVQMRQIFAPLIARFERAFESTFSRSKNATFLQKLALRLAAGEWSKLVSMMRGAVKMVLARSSCSANPSTSAPAPQEAPTSSPRKKQRLEGAKFSAPPDNVTDEHETQDKLTPELQTEWEEVGALIARMKQQLERPQEDGIAFAFVEGSLVRALRDGLWILLDEINLAAPETLERVAAVLEQNGSLALTERGDAHAVPRHSDFRIFAAMNPPTDFGKKDLSPAIRSRFTEIYVEPISSDEDIQLLVAQQLSHVLPHPPVQAIVGFYQAACAEAERTLLDGANQRPQYSLRSLCRALSYAASALSGYGLERALWDGFHMTFVTQLQHRFQPLVEALLLKHIITSKSSKTTPTPPPAVAPPQPSVGDWVQFGGFWVSRDPRHKVHVDDKYIITPVIDARLRQLARMAAARRFPVLLQGPTSAGKTSMVERLAHATGHRLVRINNHEHTDVQEYIGSFQPDLHGRLVFCDGALAQAVRHGYWIVLDELNLAPSEVLEALNRLLDDNRELLIPETNETIRPHEHFMLFATQNPPGTYGGRKILSRAFRNRFIELQMDEIPAEELRTILEKRCSLPASFCARMVDVMLELQRRRSSSRVFQGKDGFITPRDLFRWADRKPATYQELAEAGYMLLGERLRTSAECAVVSEVIHKLLPRVVVDPPQMYARIQQLYASELNLEDSSAVWIRSTIRLYGLVATCMENDEPVLLVGETGTGKTTVCQLYAQAIGQKLHMINCHQHTETSDFIGGLRPARGRTFQLRTLARLVWEIEERASHIIGKNSAGSQTPINVVHGSHVDVKVQVHQATASGQAEMDQSLAGLLARINAVKSCLQMAVDESQERAAALVAEAEELQKMAEQCDSLFVWQDGPLVTAMRQGEILLIDEISLADDAVLERLNSVLDPARLLVLPEKGNELEELRAAPTFRLLATMNPGGDYGKKELSPALRNRFTEIWVPAVTAKAELLQLLHARLGERTRTDTNWDMAEDMLSFVDYLARASSSVAGGSSVSLRDLTAWVDFVNATVAHLGAPVAFVHGACLVFIDGMGLQVSAASAERRAHRHRCLQQLVSMLTPHFDMCLADLYISHDTVPELPADTLPAAQVEGAHVADLKPMNPQRTRQFGLAPFFVPMGAHAPRNPFFSLRAPTTRANTFRVLRALQLRKPVLLEGSPGVGKTSLVQALGVSCGHAVVRINLSEQSDLMELLGADLPVEGAPAGTYAWQDGAFLSAMRLGKWVILDELNLAPQSVLEGLNACLDHRASVYVPELATSFDCAPGFRVFACQNPIQQGGGRKGLPKSFLNRFTRVWMEELDKEDMLLIISAQFQTVDSDTITKMITFVRELQNVAVSQRFAGAPWDFNLRDTFRWCELMVDSQKPPYWQPWEFLDALFLQRLRADADRLQVLHLYADVIGVPVSRLQQLQPQYSVTRTSVQVGSVWLPRSGLVQPNENTQRLLILPSQLRPLQAFMTCMKMNWMAILAGGPGSGKTSIARLLAILTQHRLQEVTLSTATDTTELLGCFEQSEPSRLIVGALSSTAELVSDVSGNLLALGTRGDHPPKNSNARTVAQLQMAWERVGALGAAASECTSRESNAILVNEEWDDSRAALLEQVLVVLENADEILSLVKREAAPPSDVRRRIDHVRTELLKAQQLRASGVRGRFVWVDGPLVTAIERGDWLMLDNANFCNPSVLDRLNPLLERGGALQLPECGLQSDGSVREIRAHQEFRLILSIDPGHGDLSRAMRNRGVEVALNGPPFLSRDVASMLCVGWALPPYTLEADSCLPLKMAETHNEIVRKLRPQDQHNASLLQWNTLTMKRVQRGAPMAQALQEAAEIAYGVSTVGLDSRNLVQHWCHKCAEESADSWAWAKKALSLDIEFAPTAWPITIGSANYAGDACGATVTCQATVLCQLVSLVKSSASLPPSISESQLQSFAATAAFEFALRASDVDSSLRVDLVQQLINQLTEISTPSRCCRIIIALQCCLKLLELVRAHPLRIALRSALSRACGGNKLLDEGCATSSWDLQRSNLTLFEAIRRHTARASRPDEAVFVAALQVDTIDSNEFSQDATSNPEAWVQAENFLSRLRMLLKIETEWLYAKMQLEEAAANAQPHEMTLLQRSLAQRQHGEGVSVELDSQASDDRAVWFALVAPLHRCLSGIHDALVHWLQLPTSDVNMEQAHLQSLHNVWLSQQALWQHCDSLATCGDVGTGLDRQKFLVLWRALHKRLAQLVSCGTSFRLDEQLRTYCDQVSKAAQFDPSHFSAVLWKQGGHPSAPRTRAQLTVHAEIRALASQLCVPFGSSGKQLLAETPTHPSLWTADALRRALVNAASTVRSCWELARTHDSRADELLHEMPTALRLQLAESQEMAKAAVAAGLIPPELQVTVQQWKLRAVRNVRHEVKLLKLLAPLVWSCVKSSSGKLHSGECADVANQAEVVADLLGLQPTRTPLDAVPAQMLAWRLSAQSGNVEFSSGASGRMVGAMQELELGWHRHLWEGSFLDIDDSISELCNGPASLYLCLETPLICAYLQGAEAASLALRSSTAAGLHKLHALLLERGGASVDAAWDWRHLLHTLCITLLAFRKTLPYADRPKLAELLKKVNALCIGVFSGASDKPESSTCDSHTTGVSLPTLLQSMKVLLAGSDSVTLTLALEELVFPCLDQLSQAVQLISAELNSRDALLPLHALRGSTWVLLGLLRWRLLLPSHPVDPACKYGLKADVLRSRLDQLNLELRVHELVQDCWNGALSSADLRARRADVEHLQSDLDATAKRISFRPNQEGDPTFRQLHTELWNWGRSLGDCNTLRSLSVDLESGITSAFARETSWQQSSSRFLQRLGRSFPDFEDIVTPLQVALYQIKHGMRLQAAARTCTAIAAEDGAKAGADAVVAQSIACALLSFPQRGARGLNDACTGDDLPRSLLVLLQPFPARMCSCFPKVGNRSSPVSEQQWRISQQTSMGMLAMRRLYIMVLLSGSARRRHLSAMSRIMGAFAQIQVDVDAAEKLRVEEQASLYKHRARSYGAESDKAIKEQTAELKQLFPDFSEEFADLTSHSDHGSADDNCSTDFTPIEQETSSTPPADPGKPVYVRVEADVIMKMLTYHERIFHPSHCSKVQIAAKQSEDVDEFTTLLGEARRESLTTLQLAYHTASQILPSIAALLPASLDGEATATHLTLVSQTWQRLEGRSSALSSGDGKDMTPDLFRDEGPTEVARLEPILANLSARTRELLEQWSDHAGLQLLLQVCERLQSFRTGSALMKFIIGAELLLKHCWEWEAVACRATSIKGHIDALTALVLRWRKMELNSWPQLLQRVAQQEHETALVKVWVHLFRLMNAPLVCKTVGDDAERPAMPSCTDASYHVDPEDERTHLLEFVTTLEELITGSEAGAFEAYIRVLRSFEHQMAAEETFGTSNSVAANADITTNADTDHVRARKRSYKLALHNVVAYYSQFSESLEVAIKHQTLGIENKLREYSKLCQWSDRNFVALKQSVERSHAQLNRCVTQYQSVLRQPAISLLSSTLGADVSELDQKHVVKYEEPTPSEELEVGNAIMQLAAQTTNVPLTNNVLLPLEKSLKSGLADFVDRSAGETAQPLQSARLPALCARMRSICSSNVINLETATRSAARRAFVDNLRHSIMLRSEDLKKLTSKKARQMKHKALVDLLKELQAVGLSFHASVADARQQSSAHLFLVDMGRVDFSSVFPSSMSASFKLCRRWQQSWERSERLHFRCFFRLTQLRKARGVAHDDLSQREIHKAAGFAEHGFTLLLRQRESIQCALAHCSSLQVHLEQLDAVADTMSVHAHDSSALLPQQSQLFDRLRHAHDGLDLLLHVCMETSVVFDQLCAMANEERVASREISLLLHRCCRSVHDARSLLPDIALGDVSHQEVEACLLLSAKHELALETCYTQIVGLFADLAGAMKKLKHSEMRLLEPLKSEIEHFVSSGRRLADSREPVNGDSDTGPLIGAVEAATVQLMLAMQNVRVLNTAPRAFDSMDVHARESILAHSASTEEPGSMLRPAEEHILCAHEWLSRALDVVRGEHLCKCLHQVEKELCILGGGQHEATRAVHWHALHLRPALSTYLASLRWVLHQAIEYHASLVRFQLVLIGTFHSLFSKGFCTQNEQEDDGSKGDPSGKGDFEDDVEGTGMGEGEGKQDVSQEMTEEGQLEGDSAARQDDEKSKDNEREERAKEEEGVEMTNEFDGEMRNMEKTEEQNHSEDESQDNEPEHEMGELDEDDQEVVDERLWNKDEDEELQPRADDKVERDAAVDPSSDTQLEAKEEENEQQKRKQEASQASNETDKPQEEADDDGKGDQEGSQDEGGEGEDEEAVRPETEYEDSHHKDLSQQNQEDTDMPEELPDALDEADDGSDGGSVNDAQDNTEDNSQPADQDNVEPQGIDDQETLQAPDETTNIDEEQTEEVDAQDLPEGTYGEDDAQRLDDEDKEDPAPNDEDDLERSKSKQYDEQQTFEDTQGANAAKDQVNDSMVPTEGEAGAEQDDSAMASHTKVSDDGRNDEADDVLKQGSINKNEPSTSKRSQPQPNPYAELGDALEHWHKQLKLVQRQAVEQDEEMLTEEPTQQPETADALKESMQEFEIIGKEEKADTQVLADATLEQYELSDQIDLTDKEVTDEGEKMEHERKESKSTNDVESAAEPRPHGRSTATKSQEAQVEVDHDIEMDEADDRWKGGEGEFEAPPDEHHQHDIRPKDPSFAIPDEELPVEAMDTEQAATDLKALQMNFELQKAEWQLSGSTAAAAEIVWRRYEARTIALAQELCEQLRLILEATVASKLQGDYRTGKRISMRKVIPYIASGFRKDKIWLRRTKPSKREYQIMLCIDDSESMRHTGAGTLACEALAVICQALSRVEVGQLAVLSFAERIEMLHPFDQPFSAEAGAHMLSRFTFNQKHTHMEELLSTVVSTLRLVRETQRNFSADQMQLAIIVSDGRRSPSWGDPQQWIRRAAQEHILLCFVIVDAAASKDSILDLQSVTYPNGVLTISRWIDAFPFPYYIVLRDLQSLPQVLSDALRQWFELLKER